MIKLNCFKRKYTLIFLSLIFVLFLIPNFIDGATNTPYVEYNFNNNLTDQKGHSTLHAWPSTNDGSNRTNSSTSFGKDSYGPYWQWESNTARGGGFWIDIDKDIGEEYTIGLKFSFETTGPGWIKIIDYLNSTSDTGFYFSDEGHLNFYRYGVNSLSVTNSNQVVDMIVRRDAETKTFEAYIVNGDNKTLELSIVDSSNQGVPTVINGKTRLGFFFDDKVTASEATPGGKVYAIKIWGDYVDSDDVVEDLKPVDCTVNVHYKDEQGNTIKADKQVNGQKDKTYDITPDTIYGYEYVRTEGESSGVFTETPKDITFIYREKQSSVQVHYKDEQGNTILADNQVTGQVGKNYNISPQNIYGYEYVRTQGESSGVFAETTKEVTFIYRTLIPYTVTAMYVDQDGNKLCDDIIYKGNEGEKYKTSRITINGYDFLRVEGDEDGVFAYGPKVVKYVYKQTSSDGTGDSGSSNEDYGIVTAKYIEESSSEQFKQKNVSTKSIELYDDIIYTGVIGEEYQTSPLTFPGYELVRVDGEEKGYYAQNDIVVTYNYKKIESPSGNKAGSIIIRYQDTQGHTLREDVVKNGDLGQKYSTEEVNIPGYELYNIVGEQNGVFKESVQEIIYVYNNASKTTASSVVVQYQDESGYTIKDDKIINGNIGDSYKTQKENIRGYIYIKVEGEENGVFDESVQFITYIYKDITGNNVDINGDGNPDINIDIDGDNVPDINIDADKDGIPDINVDINNDNKPDINIDTDNTGVWKPSNDGGNADGILKPDTNLDINGDGKPDIDKGYRPGYDVDKDGIDDSWNPNINVDIDKDGIPDYETSNPNLNVDTNGDGKPDINIDIDGDNVPDINVDVDNNGIPDINVDINNDNKPDINIDTDNTGVWKPSNDGGNADGILKPDTNLDINGDGKPDIDKGYRPGYDADKDGIDDNWNPNINVDIDKDGIPDYETSNPNLNVDTNGDGNPDINIDVNGDSIPDINIDTNGDGKPDISIDANADKIPDKNIDVDGDNIPDINIDTDNNGIPDINIDINNDNKPDINIDTDNTGVWKPSNDGGNADGILKPDTNLDINGDGKPDIDKGYRPGYDADKDGIDDNWNPNINVDIDKDGIPDYETSNPNLNVDTNGDGKPDINIDVNGDGTPDVNIDTNGDGIADKNLLTNKDEEVVDKETVDKEILNNVDTSDKYNISSYIVIFIFAAVSIICLIKKVREKNIV